MTRTSSSGGEGPSRFLSTSWSRILEAAGGDAQAQRELFLQYRRPVRRFLEGRTPPGFDAELAADEVMEAMLDPEFLRQADREKGRFRDFLLGLTRHRMLNAVRKWRHRKDRVSLADLKADPPAPDEERVDFETFFALELLEQARRRLAEDTSERGRREVEAIHLYHDLGRSQAEIADALSITVAAVNNHIHRGVERLRACVRAVYAPLCSSEAEMEEEVRHLLWTLVQRRRRGA